MLLTFVSFMGIKLYQIDVKCAFLMDSCKKKLMLNNPLVLKSMTIQIIFKLYTALYGLKYAMSAWHKRLSKFLLKNDFKR